ncbi:MAG: pyroglutamyl-peptidase I [Clostridia bacterium]
MKKLVLTGFQPFGGMTCNPSGDILATIAETEGNLRIVKKILPVEYGTAFLELKDLMESTRPEYVLCLGLAAGRGHLSLEKAALNINSSETADNAGNTILHSTIIPGSRECYFSNLPLEDMMEAMHGEPVKITYSAGTFVCNDIFYRLMHHIHERCQAVQGGFVHLPHSECSGDKGCIPLEDQTRILRKIIHYLGGGHG